MVETVTVAVPVEDCAVTTNVEYRGTEVVLEMTPVRGSIDQ